MRIGIIGGGVVGYATAKAYSGWADEVRVYDVVKERRNHDFDNVVNCDVVFICLPEDKLDEVFSKWAIGYSNRQNANYVLKSTVPVGTTKRLAEQYNLPNLVHSPEFLTERTAVFNAANPRVNIIGCTGRVTSAPSELRNLYGARFPHVPVVLMSSDESELVKLGTNAFFATKIAFFNELRSYADALGCDWETVVNGMLADGRIHPMHTQVPGPDGKRGFGGKCLPKDLNHFIDGMLAKKLEPMVTTAVHLRNKGIDRKEDSK